MDDGRWAVGPTEMVLDGLGHHGLQEYTMDTIKHVSRWSNSGAFVELSLLWNIYTYAHTLTHRV
jgi:hypothetical protein